MLNKKRKGMVLVLGILMSLGIAPVAFAESYSAPGVNCVDSNGYIVYAGWAYNASTTADANFQCPIIRYGLTTTDLSNLYISMTDQHSQESVSCHVISGNLNGIGYSLSNTVSTGNSWRGTTTMNMGTVDGYSYGQAKVECSVPDYDIDASGIKGYRWTD